MPVKSRTIPLFLALACAVLPPRAFAGKLEDFEKAATQSRLKQNAHKPGAHTTPDSFSTPRGRSSIQVSSSENSFFGEILRVLLFETGSLTMTRVRGGDTGNPEDPARRVGDPILPFIQTDLNYQHAGPRIFGIDGRIEGGIGPFGAQFRNTHYQERNPSDSLNLTYMHGLFRISTEPTYSFGLGLAGIILGGKGETGGFSMTFPLNLYPWRTVGFRLSPTWSWINGNLMSDYEASVAYSRRYFSVRAGFRRSKVQDQIIKGPLLGVSYHY